MAIPIDVIEELGGIPQSEDYNNNVLGGLEIQPLDGPLDTVKFFVGTELLRKAPKPGQEFQYEFKHETPDNFMKNVLDGYQKLGWNASLMPSQNGTGPKLLLKYD